MLLKENALLAPKTLKKLQRNYTKTFGLADKCDADLQKMLGDLYF